MQWIPGPCTGANDTRWTFEDGDQLLVAVKTHETPASYEYSVVSVHLDEDYFCIEHSDGSSWGWDWADVEFYIPMKSIPAPKFEIVQ